VDKTIGKITTGQVSILDGGHYIAGAVKLADGLTGLRAGMILYQDAGGYRPLPADYTTEKPATVLLEDVAGETSGAVAAAALHGVIRAGKTIFANGAPVTINAVEALRSAGIYVLGDPLPSAAAPVIVADLGDHSVVVGEDLVLTFLVAPRDEGVITRQWYSNTSASNSDGTAIPGETGENYTVDTGAANTLYFYCVAVNHLNNTEAAVTSAVSTVTITA
jgi:hypothetical protein